MFVHELGHFITARKVGMPVEEFGIGFPPRIWSITRGGTKYSINLIPLGGFVRITGEDGVDGGDDNAFNKKKIWQRALVLVAGVTMNFVLAWLVLSVGFIGGLPSIVDDSLPGSATVRDRQLQIIEVLDDTPATAAGVELGDAVTAINGQSITSFEELRTLISQSDGSDIVLDVRRIDEPMEFTITPAYNESSESYQIGIGVTESGIVSYPWYSSLWYGLVAAAALLWQILVIFATILGQLFTTGSVGADVSGPLGIAVMTGQVVDLGYAYVLQFIAILSLNLAIINIIPFPALDGGKLLFLLIEKIKGSPVNQRVENLIHNFGFLFLILLVIVITYRDAVRFGGDILGAIKGFF